ncbi:PREDICTED: uncharacterized protein LOC104823383 [Tarenaya hassleriana]|uniref:uncharacterized protein LOC104823383 n=1 Tax=Tarenaya hassleriana TaxID=28532 RepID=UPI00053C962A|nr:PREDICTED: uncharacterized protein LOC104823383 [Tarenaya hassleriana]
MENVDSLDGDEELALFLDMRRRDKKDQRVSPLPDPGPIDADRTIKESCLPTTVSSAQRGRTAIEKFLDSENDKSVYEWLYASPETLCVRGPQKNSTVELKEANCLSAVLKPLLENIPEESVSRSIKTSRRASLATGMYPMTAVNKRTVSTNEPKPSIKPLKQVASTSRTAKPNGTESRPSSSTKSAPRSSTPSGRTTSSKSSSLASALTRSSSVGKSARGDKSMVSKPSDMPGRSVSASRGKAHSSAVKSGLGERSRRQSKCSNDVNPVLIGSKMVERVVNVRKLPPPKQNDHNPARKSDGPRFGMNLSRSSLDMALRHMDIRRSMR